MATSKVEVPGYFDSHKALRSFVPEGDRPAFTALTDATRKFLGDAQDQATRLEYLGLDTSYLRATLTELAWRVGSTIDAEAMRACRARCEMALADPRPPGAATQDRLGSYGPGALPWFIKLDRSTDQLVDGPWPGAAPPVFLEKIDTPNKMTHYLQSLVVCDLAKGEDQRKELNLASAVIARLALWGGQAGYMADRTFETAFRRFLHHWQDKETGFFCVSYSFGGKTIKTVDLSLTFHMARYASRYHPSDVHHWPRVIDTLFAIKDGERTYPQGWSDDDGQATNHNNYDVVELIRLGWPHMSAGQKTTARREMRRMLDWCLAHALNANGVVVDPDTGDTVPEHYYFAAAFLCTIGYLDGDDRLGIGGGFSDGPPLRARMIRQLARFSQDMPGTLDALARLGVGPKRF